MESGYPSRLKKIRARLGKGDCLFLASRGGFDANLYHFFGEESFPAFGLVTRNDARLYSFCCEAPRGFDFVPLKNSRKQLFAALKEFRAKRVLIDSKTPFGTASRLQKKGFRVKDFGEVLAKQREVKEPCELACIRKAQGITKKAVSEVIEKQKIFGLTENQVAGLIEKSARDEGASLDAFAPIVLSGAGSANPHGVPSNKKISRDGVLLIDVGARWRNYCGDFSTTLYEGRHEEIVRALEAVKEAKKAAAGKARTGVTGRVLSDAALRVLNEYGFGKTSFKKTGLQIGHFIGLEVHEGPSLEKTTLRKGLAFTIEPGIYVQGRYGVRFEDVFILR